MGRCNVFVQNMFSTIILVDIWLLIVSLCKQTSDLFRWQQRIINTCAVQACKPDDNSQNIIIYTVVNVRNRK
jgi:hypothetical protein